MRPQQTTFLTVKYILRRTIQSELEDRLAEEILDGNLKVGINAKVIAKDDKVIVKPIK